MQRLILLLLLVLVSACANERPPELPPPGDPLTVTIADYYATHATQTLVLENIISNRPVTLQVTATCYLNSPPSFSLAIYKGTIAVETLGSNRSLQLSGTVASPGATSISCQSIEGVTGDETVLITVR